MLEIDVFWNLFLNSKLSLNRVSGERRASSRHYKT
jgi:hypothetical protein